MKKNFYILSLLVVALVLVFLIFWSRRDRVNNNLENPPLGVVSDGSISPLFMTDAEKSNHGLSLNSQVQVLGRDEKGEIMSYKIIKSEDDIITNRKELQIR